MEFKLPTVSPLIVIVLRAYAFNIHKMARIEVITPHNTAHYHYRAGRIFFTSNGIEVKITRRLYTMVSSLRSTPATKKKPSILNCPRCALISAIDNKFCSICIYPLIPSAFDEIKASEAMKLKAVDERYQQKMKVMRDDLRLEMRNQISQFITKLKPEIVREGLA
jgi:hypothetical protein